MEIEIVDILGVRTDEDEIGFKLGWRDALGYFGQIEFTQDLDTGKIRVDSEHTGKEFVQTVLQALGEKSELDDK